LSRTGFPWREVLIGAFLGVAGFGLTLLLPAGLRLSFEGALVAVIGAIYVGFGLATASRRSAIVETIGGVTMLVLATVGAAQAPWLLVLALVLHGFWDIAHHGGRITPSVPQWYPPFCAAADFVLAGLFAGIH
jgi:hypothetical protein